MYQALFWCPPGPGWPLACDEQTTQLLSVDWQRRCFRFLDGFVLDAPQLHVKHRPSQFPSVFHNFVQLSFSPQCPRRWTPPTSQTNSGRTLRCGGKHGKSNGQTFLQSRGPRSPTRACSTSQPTRVRLSTSWRSMESLAASLESRHCVTTALQDSVRYAPLLTLPLLAVDQPLGRLWRLGAGTMCSNRTACESRWYLL